MPQMSREEISIQRLGYDDTKLARQVIKQLLKDGMKGVAAAKSTIANLHTRAAEERDAEYRTALHSAELALNSAWHNLNTLMTDRDYVRGGDQLIIGQYAAMGRVALQEELAGLIAAQQQSVTENDPPAAR